MLSLATLGLDPTKLVNNFGLPGLFFIVFAESGLLIGFFLPGDSLLFTAGLLAALRSRVFDHPIGLVCAVCFFAAILGDQVGYQFGRRVGPALFTRPKSVLFKPENIEKAQTFFSSQGPKTILLARFVPVVRTFAPVVAGVGKMRYRLFSIFNVAGGLVWGVGVPLLGYKIGKRYPSLRDRLDLIAVGIIVVSLIPIAIEIVRRRHRLNREGQGDR